jgi:hypothetical protein
MPGKSMPICSPIPFDDGNSLTHRPKIRWSRRFALTEMPFFKIHLKARSI